MLFLPEVTRPGSSQNDTSSSLTSDKGSLEHLLIEALEVQDGETVHQFNDEIQSLKSLDYSDRSVNKSDRKSRSSTEDLVNETEMESGTPLEDHDFSSAGFDGNSGDGSGDQDEVRLTAGGLIGAEHDADNSSFIDGGIGVDDRNDGGDGDDDGRGGDDDDIGDDDGSGGDDYDIGGCGDGDDYDIGGGGGVSIHGSASDDSHNDNGDVGEEKRSETESNASEDQKVRHISLSNLQDEARLVVEQVLLRPQSGRLLSEDAQVANNLSMERMEGLLGQSVAGKGHSI